MSLLRKEIRGGRVGGTKNDILSLLTVLKMSLSRKVGGFKKDPKYHYVISKWTLTYFQKIL